MGQKPQGAQESTDAMMQGYIKNLDDFVGATTRNMLPTEQAMLDVRRAINPAQQQIDYDIASKYLPMFSDLGVAQQGREAMGRAANDVELLRGPGRALVQENLAAQKLADPEYFNTRARTGQGVDLLFDSLDDPNEGLSGTERAEIERSTARTNAQRGIEAPTATSAVSAAMNFGNAGAARKSQKQQAIAQAMQAASMAMPALRSGVDVLQLTTGRPSMPNQGLARFGENQAVGQTSMGLGSQLMGEVGNNTRQTADINSKKRNAFDSVMQTMNSTSGLLGSI